MVDYWVAGGYGDADTAMLLHRKLDFDADGVVSFSPDVEELYWRIDFKTGRISNHVFGLNSVCDQCHS